MTHDNSEVIVVGGGVVGAAIAYFAAKAGLSVIVLEAGSPASGTSSACEGNILLSDKESGPELQLTRYSLNVWKQDLEEHSHFWEFERKGGIIAASRESSLAALSNLTQRQRNVGIDARDLTLDELKELEPHITPYAVGASYYPDDSQVQPMLATAHLLRLARQHGARFHPYTRVTSVLKSKGRIRGVRCGSQTFYSDAVVNATGTWSADFAALAGVDLPVLPRRGFVMVTEPLPPMIHHKVYAAEYVANVGSSDAGLQSSPVVEGTPSGTILIGSSRERVGFDRSTSIPALKTMASNAAELFPFLRDVKILRHYHGFRPYCPDHLPVIGHDSRVPGLWHASGHEGAGIGLSAGTGKLLAQALSGETPELSLDAFSPARFNAVDSKEEARHIFA